MMNQLGYNISCEQLDTPQGKIKELNSQISRAVTSMLKSAKAIYLSFGLEFPLQGTPWPM